MTATQRARLRRALVAAQPQAEFYRRLRAARATTQPAAVPAAA